MASIDDVVREFPQPVQGMIAEVWQTLSGEQRRELQQLLGQVPKSFKPLKEILSIVLEQYKPVVSDKRSIAIVGPANVGKSTLYNHFISREEDRARVSPVPGTTRQTQLADTGLFTLLDTPGADAAGEVGEEERRIALLAARSADFLVIVFEATRGIKRYEKELFDTLLELEKPYIVVLNKMDLVPRRDRKAVLNAAAQSLRLEPSQVIDTVATDGTNVGRVILSVALSEPGLAPAIGRALPEYRSRLAWQRIVPAGGAAATVALIPLPLADLVPLLGIQTGLVLAIARIYGYEITLGRARELIAAFGAGLLARTAFQQLSKLGGLPGWLLSTSIAAATTVAIGYAAVRWFGYGERPTQEAMQRYVNDLATYLKEQLSDLRRRKPDEGTLRERVGRALRELPRFQTRGEGPGNREEGIGKGHADGS